MSKPADTQTHDWERIAEAPEFRSLLRDKARFIVPATVFFTFYYFALPVLVGYFPDVMKRRVWGPVNLAYLFALSQFVMTFALAAVYMWMAAKFDRREHEIISKLSP
jgi:uncharacterized membrane protein (DUF485 family)